MNNSNINNNNNDTNGGMVDSIGNDTKISYNLNDKIQGLYRYNI